MNDYQREQLDALNQVIAKIRFLEAMRKDRLRDDINTYLLYRQQLEMFQSRHFGSYCTQACFQNQTSACCSKDGIITFWADVVINVMQSSETQIEALTNSIRMPLFSNKCIYLSDNGCRWKIRPLGCALFLCDQIQANVLQPHPHLGTQWEDLKKMGSSYRWPDRPVLFDKLEQVFMSAGCHSPLMFLNFSPGLLRVKQKAGLLKNVRRP